MNSLEEKQAYYEYGPMGAGGWRPKKPPTLPYDVAALMKTFGTDRHGDPLWRFLWGGVALLRSDPTRDDAEVVGPPEAARRVYGRLSCRHLAGKTARPSAWWYRDRDNHRVRVARADLVPEGRPSWIDVEYGEFGRLRWFLERKLTPEQAVEAGVSAPDDVPPEGEYVALLTVETDEGLYYEPDARFVRLVEGYLHEELTERSCDLLAKWREKRRRDAARADAEDADRREGLTEDMTILAEKEAARGEVTKHYGGAGRPSGAVQPPPLPLSGDITTV